MIDIFLSNLSRGINRNDFDKSWYNIIKKEGCLWKIGKYFFAT